MKNLNLGSRATILLFGLFASLVFSCDESEPEDDGIAGEQKPGKMTLTLNGSPWTAELINVASADQVRFFVIGSRTVNSELIAVSMEAPKVGECVSDGTSAPMCSFNYNDVINNVVRGEVSRTTRLEVIKYDADSLVANFSFTTETFTATNGVLKVKLK